MSAFEKLVNAGPNDLVQTDGSAYTFVDADTIRDEGGQTYRLKGVDTPETAKLLQDGRIKGGTKGGELTSDLIGLAKGQGFTRVVKLDSVGAYGRPEFDLQDKSGRSFSHQILKEGVLGTTAQTTNEGVLAAEFGAFQRASKDYKEDAPWAEARNMLQEATADTRSFDEAFKKTQEFEGQAHGYIQRAKDLERDAKRAEADGNGAKATELYEYADRYKALANQYARAGANFDYKDRRSDGKAINPLSSSFDAGLVGVTESMFGIIDLIGEKTGSDFLKEHGEAGVVRARSRLADRGWAIQDYKDVDGIGDAIEFLGTNAAISLPYMAITLVGSAAAPFTGGLSLAAPASIYAGQTWNEQEGDNKNATLAITSGVIQAALDRLGLKGIISASGVGKKTLNEAAKKLAARDGISLAAAKGKVVSATKKELAGFADDAAAFAKSQITGRNLLRDGLTRIGKGGASEAVTEAMQEATGYFASHSKEVMDGTWNSWDLYDRLINASIAGGTLGAGFSTAGAAVNAGAWLDTASQLSEADASKLSRQGQYAEQEIADHGRVATIQELNDEVGTQTTARGGAPTSFDDRVKAEGTRKKNLTTGEWMAETLLATPKLWRGATRFIFTPGLQQASRSARILADTFGGNLQRTFSGANFEGRKHHLVTEYKNRLPIPKNFWAAINGGKTPNRKQRAALSEQVYSDLRGAIDSNGNFDVNLIPDTNPNKQALIDLGRKLNQVSDQMHSDQKKYNPQLGYLKNYLLKYKSFDKGAIHKGRTRFQALLQSEFGITPAEASAIIDNIVGNENVNTIDEAFSVTKGGVTPGSHQSRTLALSEKDAFKEFMEKDVFTNVSNAAKSAARYVSYQEFIGKNSEKLNERLQQMQDELTQSIGEEAAKAQTNKVAAQMKDYLDAESGNYKRPTTEAGKNLEKIQRNVMLWTTMAGLPLATISSFVEAALTMRGLTKSQIFGKDGGIESLGKELAHTLYKGMGAVTETVTGKDITGGKESGGQKVIRDLGYMQWEVGAATTTGVSETNPWQKQIYENFFKWTGLQGWTNYTRAVRASMAGDFIIDKVNLVKDSTGQKTNEVQEAEEALRNLGINVTDMVAALNGDLDPAKFDQVMADNMRNGVFNFINDAVALPQSANRPLIYQDPRFALFTQFQGFIATFTANHIPKLWGEYVKRGTPAMKYNAFALMATMIVLGFASQYLKDLIKYGESSPHLTDAEKLRRAVGASGLLGSGERILDQFFPLYEQQSKNPAEWVFNTTTGESPALGSVTRAVGGVGDIITGDVGRGAKGLAKSSPFIGPFNFISNAAKEAGDEWNFK